jgi:ribosomal protein L12E/L44/L45/RPP1/RPP2
MPCIRRASFKEVTTSGCIDVDEVYGFLVASLPDRNIDDFLSRSMSAAHPVLTVKAEANRSQSGALIMAHSDSRSDARPFTPRPIF